MLLLYQQRWELIKSIPLWRTSMMETFLTIVAIAAGIVVVVLLAKFYKKATQMPNEEPRDE